MQQNAYNILWLHLVHYTDYNCQSKLLSYIYYQTIIQTLKYKKTSQYVPKATTFAKLSAIQ